MITENGSAGVFRNFLSEELELIAHIENIVTQNQTDVIVADKVGADGKTPAQCLSVQPEPYS